MISKYLRACMVHRIWKVSNNFQLYSIKNFKRFNCCVGTYLFTHMYTWEFIFNSSPEFYRPCISAGVRWSAVWVTSCHRNCRTAFQSSWRGWRMRSPDWLLWEWLHRLLGVVMSLLNHVISSHTLFHRSPLKINLSAILVCSGLCSF